MLVSILLLVGGILTSCGRGLSAVNETVDSRRLFEWGKTFKSFSTSSNVKYTCTYNEEPTCCALTAEAVLAPEVSPGEVGLSKTTCKITKVYVPSAYEMLHFEVAANLTLIADFKTRKEKLIAFMHDDIEASNIWLERVRVHMESEAVPTGVKEDMDYLSRFMVTKACSGAAAHMSSTWVEWIEPLTVHARHPFALRDCKTYSDAGVARQKFRVGLGSADYVLVHSGLDIHEATSMAKHTHKTFEAHQNRHPAHRDAHIQTNNFFFDAGTSTFGSSLKWFLCAYYQVSLRAACVLVAVSH